LARLYDGLPLLPGRQPWLSSVSHCSTLFNAWACESVAKRELNSVKLCYAEATWLFAKLEREPDLRRTDEAKLVLELAAAEVRIQDERDVQARKQHSDVAIAKIISIATQAFEGHVQRFKDRIERLRDRRPTSEMLAALELIELRITDIEDTVSSLRKHLGGSLLGALAQEPATACRTVHGLLCTCERAANSVRGWLGSRRDWIVALIVSIVVGLVLIPVTLLFADWWNGHPSPITNYLAEGDT
jgi:hypothetical protein